MSRLLQRPKSGRNYFGHLLASPLNKLADDLVDGRLFFVVPDERSLPMSNLDGDPAGPSIRFIKPACGVDALAPQNVLNFLIEFYFGHGRNVRRSKDLPQLPQKAGRPGAAVYRFRAVTTT